MRRVAAAVVCLTSVAFAKPDKKADKKSEKKSDSKTTKAAKKAASRFEAPSDVENTPAYKYGSMSPSECELELDNRKISFQKETARGVAGAIRLSGPLHGVTFKADVEEKDRATTPYEIVDCRLALALDDFAAILEKHGIVEVRHYSIYRPPPKSWPDDKEGTRHDGAMAIDAAHFVNKDGKSLDVVKHFNGAIGNKTCGDGAAPDPVTAEATELRSILCDSVAAHLFNVVLTPNYNKPHHNHFHLEVTAGVKWFLVH